MYEPAVLLQRLRDYNRRHASAPCAASDAAAAVAVSADCGPGGPPGGAGGGRAAGGLGAQVERLARRRAEARAREWALGPEEMAGLRAELQRAAGPQAAPDLFSGAVPGAALVGWEEVRRAAGAAGPRAGRYLRASVYAMLARSAAGVAVPALVGVARRCEGAAYVGALLAEHCGADGTLREGDFRRFVAETLVATTPALARALGDAEVPLYATLACRRVFLLLPAPGGRVDAAELAASAAGDELSRALAGETGEQQGQGQGAGAGAGPPPPPSGTNWFAPATFRRVHGAFARLDATRAGGVAMHELAKYGAGSLSRQFIVQVFADAPEVVRGRLTWRSFVDLVLALECKASSPRALAWLFARLDVRKEGFLTPFHVDLFYRSVQSMCSVRGYQGVPSLTDVADEIFDMARPADRSRITLDDLLRCGNGPTVVSMLIDAVQPVVVRQACEHSASPPVVAVRLTTAAPAGAAAPWAQRTGAAQAEEAPASARGPARSAQFPVSAEKTKPWQPRCVLQARAQPNGPSVDVALRRRPLAVVAARQGSTKPQESP
eukprot:m51a1_g1724 putative serine threonine-protein phosphatase 2a regulatory subunit b subunit gamma (551) ;mRNA; f:109372-116179